jgi:homoserine kinase
VRQFRVNSPAVDSALAFAPASVGNVAVGFDVLGHSVSVLGDRVRATRTPEPGVRIRAVSGVVTDLPLDPARNTAGVAVAALAAALAPGHGFELTIDKGIPLASGLGGSAASAVAAVVAANALLDAPAGLLQLLRFAMAGEAVASGATHVDNIAASLYGGLVLTVGIDDPVVTQIPVPDVIRCVLVHPHVQLTTHAAREILARAISLSDVVWQEANLAGFVAGCFTSDLRLIRASLEDVVIEPQRKRLIPGFERVKRAAMAANALGCSISGAGPTVFAWCEAPDADAVSRGMAAAFAADGIGTDVWVAPIDTTGAQVIERS